MSLKKSAFQKNKYSVLKNAISKEMADFCFAYFLNKRKVARFLFDQRYISPFTTEFGVWNDEQVPNTYSHYGDIVMETLLQKVKPVMEKHTGLKLSETYSYARIYKKGDILKRHKDRPSCEISTTVNLGGDPWPIFIDGTGSNNVIDEYKNIHKPDAPKGTKVLLDVGDMLVYSGCELEHWREPFEGDVCGQVFLHYNHVNGPFADKNRFDKRPMLGIPPIRNI